MTKKMTLKQHRALSLRLCRYISETTDIYLEVAAKVGKTSQAAKALELHIKELHSARSKFDDIVFADYPDKPTSTLAKIYYGGEES